MARVDDYINARKMAVEKLVGQSAANVSKQSGLDLVGDNTLRIPFLDQVYLVSFPEIEFSRENGDEAKEIPIQEQVLILHYLLGEGSTAAAGRPGR